MSSEGARSLGAQTSYAKLSVGVSLSKHLTLLLSLQEPDDSKSTERLKKNPDKVEALNKVV